MSPPTAGARASRCPLPDEIQGEAAPRGRPARGRSSGDRRTTDHQRRRPPHTRWLAAELSSRAPPGAVIPDRPGDLWTIRCADRLRFPRVAAQHGEMLAFAHNSTGPTARGRSPPRGLSLRASPPNKRGHLYLAKKGTSLSGVDMSRGKAARGKGSGRLPMSRPSKS